MDVDASERRTFGVWTGTTEIVSRVYGRFFFFFQRHVISVTPANDADRQVSPQVTDAKRSVVVSADTLSWRWEPTLSGKFECQVPERRALLSVLCFQ